MLHGRWCKLTDNHRGGLCNDGVHTVAQHHDSKQERVRAGTNERSHGTAQHASDGNGDDDPHLGREAVVHGAGDRALCPLAS